MSENPHNNRSFHGGSGLYMLDRQMSHTAAFNASLGGGDDHRFPSADSGGGMLRPARPGAVSGATPPDPRSSASPLLRSSALFTRAR